MSRSAQGHSESSTEVSLGVLAAQPRRCAGCHIACLPVPACLPAARPGHDVPGGATARRRVAGAASGGQGTPDGVQQPQQGARQLQVRAPQPAGRSGLLGTAPTDMPGRPACIPACLPGGMREQGLAALC